KGLTWVLSRYHVKVGRYPFWTETVELKTWPSARQAFFALREFELHDERGELLADGTSSWMMIDLNTKRPVPLAEHLLPFQEDSRRALPDRFEPLPVLQKADTEIPFLVGMKDLDWNRHVNHVVYVEWAVESAPRDVLTLYLPVEIEVDYRGEAFFGETVLSRAACVLEKGEPELLHQIIKESDGKELVRLRTRWKKQAGPGETFDV
ncbi:MAG: acyl-ACP thioesterase, partial [Candidatus Aminicenantes bacterium]|nr:acyl-ACP thioesterase [Candidatus Aminicenantes bacterium]